MLNIEQPSACARLSGPASAETNHLNAPDGSAELNPPTNAAHQRPDPTGGHPIVRGQNGMGSSAEPPSNCSSAAFRAATVRRSRGSFGWSMLTSRAV